ncbi:hypothetical protein [Helicobacter sp. 11S02629-2]|uniref:hypothetical protein n=1 Tax=Helicobacter sp. 11S02629-2 TaxID=1476195 RepID=UPI000BA54272|nr:hypothetical protein [Helicobacter sp. 11S02629-2]PAF45376.1 hypothetical protein BKH40_04090 [Helicobacter sp. 11S02629-2]
MILTLVILVIIAFLPSIFVFFYSAIKEGLKHAKETQEKRLPNPKHKKLNMWFNSIASIVSLVLVLSSFALGLPHYITILFLYSCLCFTGLFIYSIYLKIKTKE